MSKFILLYNYNKYYNRIIKKLNTYNEYKALITPLGNTPAALMGLEISSTNFNWEDGVFAKHVINIPRGSSAYFNFHEPDYLVLERTYKNGDIDVTELSRWFVLETTKIRGNQLELSLRRDLLADFFSEALNAPVFIEKGNPQINDPAIFNRESMTYNQIKTNELKLDFNKLSGKGGGWIVGYLKQSAQRYKIENVTGQAKVPAIVPDFTELPQELQDLIDAGKGYWYRLSDYQCFFKYRYTDSYAMPGSNEKYTDFLIQSINNTDLYAPNASAQLVGSNVGYLRFKNGTQTSWNEHSIANHVESSVSSYGTPVFNKVNAWYNSLNLPNRFYTNYHNSPYNGSYFLRDGKYYKISISAPVGESYQSVSYTRSQVASGSNDLCSWFLSLCASYLVNGNDASTYADPKCVVNSSASGDTNAITFKKPEYKITFSVQEVEFDEVHCDLPANIPENASEKVRNQNLDAPYDLFCIPMKNVSVKNGLTTILTQIENVALAIARGIAIAGSSNVLDIQILPYCPFEEILNSDGDVDITSFTENKDFSYIYKTVGGNEIKVGVIVYPKFCKGTFDFNITASQTGYSDCLEELSSAIDKKIKSETKLVRFVSPNFASTFDINVQKNKGITRLNVDYFYKPYSPYIHVAPYFDGLYGQDFNDPKGLICSGEFSIATAQSEWENYQIQNKNYELIFNRQIQNLDVNNSIAYDQMRITGKIGVATAGVTGIAGGAVAGSMVGGPIGAVVGAIGGGIASAVTSGVGAKYDLEYLKKSQTEARSFASDMYAYSLGNIQALPYSLTRVSAFTENNKIFPFIEFYDATDEEKNALRNKIKYNGMTIMRIGKIADFITASYRYVQGQLVRLEGINEDSHVIAEIANEIKEGAYYYGSDSIES